MEHKQRISDELLAKYLAGKTTPEETEQVLVYLSDGDGNVEELECICEAIEVQKTAERVSWLKETHSRRQILWGISSAAAIAIIVLIVAFVGFQGTRQNDSIVVQVDTAQVVVPLRDLGNGVEEKKQKQADANNVLPTPNWQGDKVKNYAGNHDKQEYCKMILPSQELYRVSVERAYFDFHWTTDAVEQTMTLKDENGVVLYQKDLAVDDDYMKFKVSDYRQYGKIQWTLSVSYESGKTECKNGVICFEK